MEKKIKMKYPSYLKEFKCIGGKCEDSCCVGWDVDIDKTTFKQYYKVDNSELKRMFQKNIHNNEEYCSTNIDYGKVKLKKGKRCPFLDECNYCIIQSNLGEEYLSNVCTMFPRTLNNIDQYYEMSLDVACPEAARIFLLKKEGIKFAESEERIGKHIISSEIKTDSKEFKNSPLKYFKEIRDLSIKIMQNRKFSLEERIYRLGLFIEELQEQIEYNFNYTADFIKEYDISSDNKLYVKNDMNYIIQMIFFKKMVGFLNVFEEVDSHLFKEYTKMIISGFSFNDQEINDEYKQVYIQAFNDYDREFIKKNEYIFENYLVNFMYSDLFPFSESESIFDGYLMLLVRYSYIRFYLVGKYLFKKEDSVEQIVKFIQVFSKTIEHHKTYLVDMLDYIKEQEFDNMEFLKNLL